MWLETIRITFAKKITTNYKEEEARKHIRCLADLAVLSPHCVRNTAIWAMGTTHSINKFHINNILLRASTNSVAIYQVDPHCDMQWLLKQITSHPDNHSKIQYVPNSMRTTHFWPRDFIGPGATNHISWRNKKKARKNLITLIVFNDKKS